MNLASPILPALLAAALFIQGCSSRRPDTIANKTQSLQTLAGTYIVKFVPLPGLKVAQLPEDDKEFVQEWTYPYEDFQQVLRLQPDGTAVYFMSKKNFKVYGYGTFATWQITGPDAILIGKKATNEPPPNGVAFQSTYRIEGNRLTQANRLGHFELDRSSRVSDLGGSIPHSPPPATYASTLGIYVASVHRFPGEKVSKLGKELLDYFESQKAKGREEILELAPPDRARIYFADSVTKKPVGRVIGGRWTYRLDSPYGTVGVTFHPSVMTPDFFGFWVKSGYVTYMGAGNTMDQMHDFGDLRFTRIQGIPNSDLQRGTASAKPTPPPQGANGVPEGLLPVVPGR